MDLVKVKPTCEFCHKDFSSISSRNRHLRDFHQKIIESDKNQHILCPMCPEEKKLSSHNNLVKHLNQTHEVNCKESILHFRNIEEFEAWRKLENREVDYACHRKNKYPNGDELIYYSCNRSDYTGHISMCQKHNIKSGGSIRIRGICPSRIVVKILNKGSVTATFIETHVGHSDELRTKRLTKSQQNIIVEQLTAGVSNERIIKNARKVKDKTLERLNLITKGDLAYLIRKYNIDKKRDTNDMTATVLKVEERDRDGKNHTTNQSKKQDELKYCMEEINSVQSSTMDFEERREIALQEVCNFGRTLDEVAFNTFMMEIGKIKNNVQKNSHICKKRNTEKQLYYPNKKK